MLKIDPFTRRKKNVNSLKLGDSPVGFYSDPTFGLVWPFVKT